MMGYQDEEESPCIHHRSLFDTIPAPPPTSENTHVLVDPVYHLTRAGKEKLAELGLTDEALTAQFDDRLEACGVSPMRKPSEPTLMSARGDFTGKGDDGEPMRVSANGRAAFAFPGGVTEVRKPTRGELLLSAKQWATRIREEMFEIEHFEASREKMGQDHFRIPQTIAGSLDRLDAVLKELAES